MKKHIILVCVVLFSIGLLSTIFSSCNRNTARSNDGGGYQDGVDFGRDGGRRDDRDFRGGIGSGCEQSTREGGGNCEGDNDCEDQCDDLFNGRDYEECLDLSVNEVQGMWNAFDEDKGILEDPDDDDLEDIHPEDIKNAMEIDDSLWDQFVDDYSTSEAGDVLYWIADDECIYEAIEDSFDEQDDLENFMEDLFDQVDNGGLIAAAKEPLGDDPKDDDNFLVLARQTGNDRAVDLIHELLWEECISDTSSTAYNSIQDDDDQNSACLLGELYCTLDSDDDYIFEDVFDDVVDNEIDNFIRGGSTSGFADGLGIASSDYDDLDVVCGDVICSSSDSRRIQSASCDGH
ncbi:MAG: hypothetical protein OXK80_04970 [Bdellovibrionales bacterium]|nr:hypothetical protein [Bdellovibrionales bacterium]